MPYYSIGELNAFLALYGGDTTQAADNLGIDEDIFLYAIAQKRLPPSIKENIYNRLETFKDEYPDLGDTIDRVGNLLDLYPELLEIIDNDGVAEALIREPKFVDIFHRDPHVELDRPLTPLRDKETGEIRRYKQDSQYHNKGDIIYQRHSGGGLYPGAIDVIRDWATKTAKGEPRKRQRSLERMINALEADNFEIGDVDESNFWEWFRAIYPGAND